MAIEINPKIDIRCSLIEGGRKKKSQGNLVLKRIRVIINLLDFYFSKRESAAAASPKGQITCCFKRRWQQRFLFYSINRESTAQVARSGINITLLLLPKEGIWRIAVVAGCEIPGFGKCRELGGRCQFPDWGLPLQNILYITIQRHVKIAVLGNRAHQTCHGPFRDHPVNYGRPSRPAAGRSSM